MVEYGSTGNYISLSTGIAGSYPVRYPTGDMLLFWAAEWDNTRENKDKMKEMSNNNSYNNRMGKMARQMSIRKLIMMDDDDQATTNTMSYNNKITLLDSWCGLNKAAVYLIVTPIFEQPTFVQPNTNKTVNIALSRKGTSTPLDYFKCTLKRIHSKPVGGVYMVDLILKETSLY